MSDGSSVSSERRPKVMRAIARLNVGGPARHAVILEHGLRRRGFETLLVHGSPTTDEGSLEDLIADTGDGLLIETNRSWSIDNRRLHFQFEGEAAWEITGGERGRLLRNPSYAGVTPEFWGSCDAVCSPAEWRMISLLDCGKDEPGQVMRVSHGTAPARFRDVQVGVA